MGSGNSRLVQQQADFAWTLGHLLAWARGQGYTVTVGEVERPTLMAKMYAAAGIGIENSQHVRRLAADLKLYIGGVYQTDSTPYARMATEWERLDKRARWGGRFPKPDGGHFEFVSPTEV